MISLKRLGCKTEAFLFEGLQITMGRKEIKGTAIP